MAKTNRIFNRDTTLILLGSFCYMSNSMLVNPLIVGFTTSLGESAVVAGLIAAMMNLTSLVFRPFAGQVTDRVSKYRLALIGGILLLVAAIGYVTAISGWMLIIVRIINGLGFALCSICMATWLAGLLPRDRIGAGMGYYGMMNALGMAVAPALGIFMYQHFGYRVAFMCAVVLSGLLLIMIQFISDHGEPLPQPDKATKPHHLIQRQVVPVAIMIMLLAIPYFATQSYLVEYVASRHFHVMVGSFFLIYAVILLVLRLGLKDYFDRLPYRYFLLAGLISNLVGMIGMAYLFNNWMMLVAAAGLAGGYGVMYSVCQATSLLIAPLEEQGLANATFYIGMDSGMVLGPVIGGGLFDFLPHSLFYPALMITVPLVILVYVIYHRQLATQ